MTAVAGGRGGFVVAGGAIQAPVAVWLRPVVGWHPDEQAHEAQAS
jgi:hypothetical protein